jgi:ribosomal protein S18 acetylase RimI-like enzyme
MQIKRLRTEDASIACEISTLFKSKHAGQEYMQKFLSNESNYLLVAFEKKKPVGFILGYRLERVDTLRPMMFVYEIEVLEPYRKKGIAKALVNEFLEICKEHHYLKMFVITNESNISAMALYQSTGGKRKSKDDAVFRYDYFLIISYLKNIKYYLINLTGRYFL